MRLRTAALSIALTFAALPPVSGASQPANPSPRAHALVDVSCPDDSKARALKSLALLSEWYPRINAILYGPDHPLPFEEVVILFEPSLDSPAVTHGNTIEADCDSIGAMRDDYRAMIIHELTHVVQHYPSAPPEASWVIESIADYIRHKYFESDIQALLNVGEDGVLFGYTDEQPYLQTLQDRGVSLDRRGYRASYTVGSTFLFWLETHKDAKIVEQLNLALAQRQFTEDLFRRWCGMPLEELWSRFVTQSKSQRTDRPGVTPP